MKLSKILFVLATFSSAAFARDIEFRLDVPTELSRDYSAGVVIGLRYANGHQQAWTLFNRDELASGLKSKSVAIDADQVKSCTQSWTVMERPPRSPRQPEEPAAPLLAPRELRQAIEGPCQLDRNTTIVRLSPEPYRLEPLEVIVEKGALARRRASELLAVSVSPKTSLDTYQNFHFGRTASENQLPLRSFSWILLRAAPTYEVQSTWFIDGDFSDELIQATQSPISIR